jgi:Flp pilus assembly protein TadG
VASRHKQPERGGVLVEAAIALPVLWLFLAAIVQFGYAYSVLITMQNAAVVAARTATLGSGRTSSEVCEVARTAAATLVEPARLVCSTAPALPASPDTLVTVALAYPMAIPFYGEVSVFGESWTLETRAVMQ